MTSPPQVCEECGAVVDAAAKGRRCLRCALDNALSVSSLSASLPGDEPVTQSGIPFSRRTFGDYELLEELGRGGMGVVYRARQKSLGRLVAIKMILQGEFAKKEFVTRFRAEASAAAVLQHPNIVAIHEVGLQERQHYFSMDYIPGRTLAEIAREGPLPHRRAVPYVRTVAEAIHYAHEQGVLHLDLKPANVIIDSCDQPKVTDFGLAKWLDPRTQLTSLSHQLTLTGQILGSPHYMAPEQVSARRYQVSRRTDVYALGAMLYQLLTGRPPFVAEEITDTLNQILSAEPIAPRLMHPAVPRDLETICLKCLDKNPDKRYATAELLAQDLSRFLRDEPILARPVGTPEKIWRSCRRKPVVALLTGAVVLAIFLGFTGVTWKERRAREAQMLAERRLYAAQMSQAYRSWEAGSLNVANALLNAQLPTRGKEDLRGADWRWLWSLCQNEAEAVLPTQGEWQIYTAEPSPDGRLLATAGSSTSVVVYDLTGQAPPKILRGHTRALLGLCSIAFSPDGKRLVSASGGVFQSPEPGELFIWDLATADKLVLQGHKASLWAVAFSPDGRYVASGCLDGTVGLWDAKTGQNLTFLRGHERPVYTLAFSSDSKSLFSSGEDGTIRRWDVAVRQEILPFFEQRVPVYSLDLAPDDQTIATSAPDKYIRLWDVASGRVRALPQVQPDGTRAPQFSPDGKLLAFGTAKIIRIWDCNAEREVRVLRGASGPSVNLRFLPDGKHLVSACQFAPPMLWNLERPEKVVTLGGFREDSEGIAAMTVSADQRWLVAGSGDFFEPRRPAEVIVFDLEKLQPALPPLAHPQRVNSVSLSNDGSRLVTGCSDGSVRIFSMPAGSLLRTFTNMVADRPGSLICSPRDKLLVAYNASPRQFAIWNTETWAVTPLLRDVAGNPQNFAFSPDGSLLATPMEDARGTTIIWNMPAGTTNTVIRADSAATGAAFAPDGKIFAIHTIVDIHLYEVKTWKLIATLKGHDPVIVSISFAPDGKTLASVGLDGGVRLWNMPAGAELFVLYDQSQSAQMARFTTDGRWLISGSLDHVVKLRRLPSFDEIQAAGRALSQ